MDSTLHDTLTVLSAFRGLEVVLRVAPKTAKWVWERFLDHVDLPGKRRELIEALFVDKRDILFHPGTDWRPAEGQTAPPYTARGYPHEVRALRAFTPFFPEESRYQETLFFPSSLEGSSRLICTGSTKTNNMVRKYLPSLEFKDGKARQQYASFLRTEDLTYLFGEDLSAPMVEVVSMMSPGATKPKTRKMIWKWRAAGDLDTWQPKNYMSGKSLNSDFLLISRLPRTSVGGDILIFAGGHGAGTEAVTLLLNQLPLSQLRDLVDQLQDKPYYQFVIEVTEVRHEATGTIPIQIKISDEMPPVKLPIGATNLRDKAVCPTKVWS